MSRIQVSMLYRGDTKTVYIDAVGRGVEQAFHCPNKGAHKHGDATPSASWHNHKGIGNCLGCSANFYRAKKPVRVISHPTGYDATYIYDELHSIVRTSRPNGKKSFKPLKKVGENRYIDTDIADEFPIYTPKKTYKKVVWVEGEKCADALNTILPDGWGACTWQGGSKAITKNKRKILAEGERATENLVLCDADADGRKASSYLSRWMGCKAIDIAPERTDGYDIADMIEEGKADKNSILQVIGGQEMTKIDMTEATLDADGFNGIFNDLGIAVRHNVRSHRHEYQASDGEWYMITDGWDVATQVSIENRYFIAGKPNSKWEMATARWQKYLAARCEATTVDPFIEWLEILPAWDGKERLSTLLVDALGAEDSMLNAFASALPLLQAIAYAYAPGVPVSHEMVILMGGQDIGKSTFVRKLLPSQYVKEGVVLTTTADPDRKMVESIGDGVLVEVPEVDRLTKQCTIVLKQLLSTQKFTCRLAYRRNAEDFLRRHSFVGTTNSYSPVPIDDTGHRRYLPVKVNVEDKTAAEVCERVNLILDGSRDQLWAEALVVYNEDRDGCYRMPALIKQLQRDMAASCEYTNEVVVDALHAYLYHDAASFAPDGLTLYSIKRDCDSHAVQSASTAVLGSAMRALGYESKRVIVDGRRDARVDPF